MARRETAARRYAEAAFEIGRADGTLDAWERDLRMLRDALADPELAAVAKHPGVAYAVKERIIRRAVTDVADEPLNLVLLMIRRGRPGAVARTVERFDELLRAQRGIALAQVRTALPLEDRERTALTARLREMTQAKMEMNEVVDESLIGGIAVRIGDQLYDASVRSRLERLRVRLTAV
jgi:F-type H+-transporting ATPase subunit delta